MEESHCAVKRLTRHLSGCWQLICNLSDSGDLQPATIVEDRGSWIFSMSMTQSTSLLYSCRTIMRSLLPDLYETAKKEPDAKLADIKYCALTTDLWTIRATQGYITVTCHFLSNSWELHSAVLDTLHVDEAHTAENLAAEQMVTDTWGITEKLVCAITDDANNIVAAIRLNGWKHLPCFACTLNNAV